MEAFPFPNFMMDVVWHMNIFVIYYELVVQKLNFDTSEIFLLEFHLCYIDPIHLYCVIYGSQSLCVWYLGLCLWWLISKQQNYFIYILHSRLIGCLSLEKHTHVQVYTYYMYRHSKEALNPRLLHLRSLCSRFRSTVWLLPQ